MDTCVSYLGVVMWVSIWPYDITDKTPLWKNEVVSGAWRKCWSKNAPSQPMIDNFAWDAQVQLFSAWDAHDRLVHISSYWQIKLKDKFQPVSGREKKFQLGRLDGPSATNLFSTVLTKFAGPWPIPHLKSQFVCDWTITKVKIWWH